MKVIIFLLLVSSVSAFWLEDWIGGVKRNRPGPGECQSAADCGEAECCLHQSPTFAHKLGIRKYFGKCSPVLNEGERCQQNPRTLLAGEVQGYIDSCGCADGLACTSTTKFKMFMRHKFEVRSNKCQESGPEGSGDGGY